MGSTAPQALQQGTTVTTLEGWRLCPRHGVVMRIVPGSRAETETAQIAWADGDVGFVPTWTLHPCVVNGNSPGYLRRAAQGFDRWRVAYVPGRIAKAAWAVAWGLGRSLRVFLAYLLSAYLAGHVLFALSGIPLRHGPFVPVLELLVGAMLLVPALLVGVVLLSLRNFGNKGEDD